MWEGTTSRVMAADRPYGEFYNFYSISPENFGSTHVYYHLLGSISLIISIQKFVFYLYIYKLKRKCTYHKIFPLEMGFFMSFQLEVCIE